MCGNIYVSILCIKFGVTILNWSEPMYINYVHYSTASRFQCFIVYLLE